MSYDIFVERFPADAKSISDIPSDFESEPIGKRSDLIMKIKEVVPEADFYDLSCGIVEGEDWSVEISIGTEDEVGSFSFHVRGSGEASMGVVAAILDHLHLRALDAQTGEFFAAEEAATKSFAEWRSFRDRVVEGYSPVQSSLHAARPPKYPMWAVVMVPAGFEHPKDENGKFIPGAHYPLVSQASPLDRTHFVIYENDREGIPISPVFPDKPAVMEWLLTQGYPAEEAERLLRLGINSSPRAIKNWQWKKKKERLILIGCIVYCVVTGIIWLFFRDKI